MLRPLVLKAEEVCGNVPEDLAHEPQDRSFIHAFSVAGASWPSAFGMEVSKRLGVFGVHVPNRKLHPEGPIFLRFLLQKGTCVVFRGFYVGVEILVHAVHDCEASMFSIHGVSFGGYRSRSVAGRERACARKGSLKLLICALSISKTLIEQSRHCVYHKSNSVS